MAGRHLFRLRNGIQKFSTQNENYFVAHLVEGKKRIMHLFIDLYQAIDAIFTSIMIIFVENSMKREKMCLVTVFIFQKVKKVKSTVVKFLIKIRLQI